jgi:membrane-associated protein
VGLHVGLGWAFADRIVALGNLLGNLSGLLAAAAVTAVLGLRLYSTLRARNQRDGPDTDPTDS